MTVNWMFFGFGKFGLENVPMGFLNNACNFYLFFFILCTF